MPRIQLQLIEKNEISRNIFLLKLQATSQIRYHPGQLLSVEVAPKTYRSYSIVNFAFAFDSDTFHFLIDTQRNGLGSTYIKNLAVGSSVNCIGPSGKFEIKNTLRPKIFVATSTGLAPFLGMIAQSSDLYPEIEHKVIFGTKSPDTNYGLKLFQQLNLNSRCQFYSCFSNSDTILSKNQFQGYVTKNIPLIVPNLIECDFYLCGKTQMIVDVQELLLEKQVPKEQIFKEVYELGK